MEKTGANLILLVLALVMLLSGHGGHFSFVNATLLKRHCLKYCARYSREAGIPDDEIRGICYKDCICPEDGCEFTVIERACYKYCTKLEKEPESESICAKDCQYTKEDYCIDECYNDCEAPGDECDTICDEKCYGVPTGCHLACQSIKFASFQTDKKLYVSCLSECSSKAGKNSTIKAEM